MKIEVTEAQAIDHSINLVTHLAVSREMHTLRQEGIIIQDREQLNTLTMDMRVEVQRMLEASN